MDHLPMHTPNQADENFRKLAALFPNAVTETIDPTTGEVVRAIDKDILMQEISARVVEGREERYQFTWPDKRKAILAANAPIAATLRPVRADSVGRDGTPGGWDSQNLYIEGDNLDVLKLLQETYLGRVKMIYIDPPYNTGNDFVYADDFTEDAEEYLARSGQFDDQGNRLEQNTESNGRFHTDWLNMLYSRLRFAKNLLSDDGIIAISIDEHEIDNCTKVCDDVFGRINRIGIIIIKSNPRGSMSTGIIGNLHEYLVLYARNAECNCIIGQLLSDNMTSEYKYNDENGPYRLLGLRMRGGFWRRTDRPNLYFPLYIDPNSGLISVSPSSIYSETVYPIQPTTGEDGTWRWSLEKIKTSSAELVGKTVIRDGQVVWDVFQKDYLDRGGERRTKVKSIWDASEFNYQNGTTELRDLFGQGGVFDYAKPVYLLHFLLTTIRWDPDDIVLDFFSGSATTAHAVMQINAEDGGHRRFIMVQLPEQTDEKSEAYKAGYRTICEIGKERIRRAGRKIKEEAGLSAPDLDIGFRVLRLDSSNMQDVYYNPAAMTRDLLDLTVDNIKPDRSPEDLLFQVMLDLGVELSSAIEEQTIDGKKVFIVRPAGIDSAYLIACFDTGVTSETVTAIAKMKPYYAVFRDAGMATDSVATNFDQIFETYSPQTVRKVL